MNTAYYQGNRERLYAMMQPGSLLMLFSGEEIRKTNDEYYPFFADRSFVYFTGLKCRQAVLLALKDAEGSVAERLYLLPPDAIAERWTGTRIKPQEAESVSGVEDVRFVGALETDFSALANSGNYGAVYLDLYRISPADIDRPAHGWRNVIQREYPFLRLENANYTDPPAAAYKAALRDRGAT